MSGAGPQWISPNRARARRFIKRFLPRGLFGRSLIIIVAPMVLLQGDRHLCVLRARPGHHHPPAGARCRRRRGLAGDAGGPRRRLERDGLRALAARQLRYRLTFHAGTSRCRPTTAARQHHRRGAGRYPRTAASAPAAISAPSASAMISTSRWTCKDGVLEILVPRDRVTVSKPDIFILWMVGSALILLGIAILFLRNQVRPIERLARAAEVSARAGRCRISSPMAPPKCAAPPRPSSPCASASNAMSPSAPRCWRGSATTSRRR